MAKKLQVEPQAAPPPDLPDALKLFPARLVALANAHGKATREQLAELAGRHPAQVGRWLKYEGLGDLAASAIINLEGGFGLAPGSLLCPNPIEVGSTSTVWSVSSIAAAMGLSPSIVAALADGSGETMREFGDNLKRAVLGAVHLLGFPLESATRAAREAAAERSDGDGLTPEMWLSAMRPYLRGKPESGTYPSSGKIKIG